jgi:hypothetical protein
MLRTKPFEPVCAGAFTHIAGITAGNQIAASRFTTFRLGAHMIQCARTPQWFPAVRTLVAPKIKNVLSKSRFCFSFTKEFGALDVMFHVGTAL